MNILELIQQDNFKTDKKATTLGGEYKGECPWCGGNDRFTIWPNHPSSNTGGRYICRQCGKSGDAITYLKDFRGLSYRQACTMLDITPDMSARLLDLSARHPNTWTPRDIKSVPEIWQQKAESLLFQDFKTLLSSDGKKCRDYLSSRGLTVDTIKRARIGLRSQPLTFDRAAWGLEPASEKDAKDKAVWIPAGIIIPHFSHHGGVVRLRIRQERPVTKDRYILVAGSATAFLRCLPAAVTPQSKPVVSIIVESELDAWLIHQEAGDLINVFAAGNAQARPDAETHTFLVTTPILVSLDVDIAGQKETAWWLKHYPGPGGAIIHEVPQGKDPGEAWQLGVNIREWVIAGIAKLPISAGQPGPILPTVDVLPHNIITDLLDVDKKPHQTNGHQPPPIIPIKPIPSQGPADDRATSGPSAIPHTPRIFPAATCLHGGTCAALKFETDEPNPFEGVSSGRNVCLLRDTDITIFEMLTCPKNKWYKPELKLHFKRGVKQEVPDDNAWSKNPENAEEMEG